MEHNDLLIQAKQSQQQALRESEILSHKLSKSIESIVIQNSNLQRNNLSSVLDKITTIHQIDQQITKQINHDICINYEGLINDKKKLIKLINRIKRLLATKDGNLIHNLQKRAELIDQELRILEMAEKFIQQK